MLASTLGKLVRLISFSPYWDGCCIDLKWKQFAREFLLKSLPLEEQMLIKIRICGCICRCIILIEKIFWLLFTSLVQPEHCTTRTLKSLRLKHATFIFDKTIFVHQVKLEGYLKVGRLFLSLLTKYEVLRIHHFHYLTLFRLLHSSGSTDC